MLNDAATHHTAVAFGLPPATAARHAVAIALIRLRWLSLPVLFDPAAQQAADLGHHARRVAVLAAGKPVPAGGQPQVDPHPLQCLVGPLQPLPPRPALAVVGLLQPLPQVKGRIQQPPGEGVAVGPGKVVGPGSSQSKKSKVRVKMTISSRAILPPMLY